MSFSFQLKAKKTPFQKQKELEEKRKKKDDEEAAKVYEDFVKEFGGDEDEPKSFVHGETIQPGQSAKHAGPPTSGRRHYIPPSAAKLPPPTAAALKTKEADEPVFQLSSSAGRSKPRAIDLLLQDLKQDQAVREQRKEQGLDPPEQETPVEHGEQGSTNLFVGNLAPHVDESMLLHEFGRFGPIGSVKIMWPRDEEQRRRGKNTGFVAFMHRGDAERARDALDGITLHDMILQVGFGKSVPLPAVPVWPPAGGVVAGVDGIGIVVAPAAPESTRQRMHDGPPPKEMVQGRGPDIQVSIPEDPRQRFVIDAVAYYVMRDGCEFEQAVMQRECSNAEFAFLFDIRTPEHAYYRWRLFSLANGDSLRSWRVDPFLMVESSNRWIPPPISAVAAAQKSAAQRGDRREEAPMPDAQRERMIDMLRKLNVGRSSIRDAMVFALDHADCSAEVSDLLIDSLTLAETPAPLKVARLFLLSDILHNTSASVRNASRFRGRLQEALPDVFESLQEAYRSAGGRMAQEQLRKHVLKVLRVWRGWYIFSDDFVNGLQATFLRGGTGPAGSRSAASGPDAGADGGLAIDASLQVSLAAKTDDELELSCKHSGLSRKGGREAQIARLLALDVYLNGSKSKAGRQSTAFVAEQHQQQQQWHVAEGTGRQREPLEGDDEQRRQRARKSEGAVAKLGGEEEAAAGVVAERQGTEEVGAQVPREPADRADGPVTKRAKHD